MVALAHAAPAAEGEFSKPVIDLGIVVKDAGRTAQFLTNAIGFKEVRGFPVTAELGRKLGLSTAMPRRSGSLRRWRVETATRIKVLSFPRPRANRPIRPLSIPHWASAT